MDQNRIDEMTEENATENHQHFRTGEGSMIEPKTSFFTSSQMKEESSQKEVNMTPNIIIESKASDIIIHDNDDKPQASGLDGLVMKNLELV